MSAVAVEVEYTKYMDLLMSCGYGWMDFNV